MVLFLYAYFTQKGRFDASNAGKTFGFDIICVFYEPISRAFGYELAHDLDRLRKILIYYFEGKKI